MSKLIKMDGGSWVDAAAIQHIIIRRDLGPSCTVEVHTSTIKSNFPSRSEEEAVALADKIAADANAARD